MDITTDSGVTSSLTQVRGSPGAHLRAAAGLKYEWEEFLLQAQIGYSYAVLEETFEVVQGSLDSQTRDLMNATIGNGVSFGVSVGIRLDVLSRFIGSGGAPSPPSIRIKTKNVFPAFYKRYDTEPFGEISVENTSRQRLNTLEVHLHIPDYMDKPRVANLSDLLPGEVLRVPLYALFSERILDITETLQLEGTVTIRYSVTQGYFAERFPFTVTIMDRNALTWDDDRRVCAFVTPKDPNIQRFAKHAAAVADVDLVRAVDPNLLRAMALHEAITEAGVYYISDTSTPYIELSQDERAIDNVQFPAQTLDFGAGDCDDLSSLYAALLEAIGIETAFVTIPGHLYMAFAMSWAPETVLDRTNRWGDFIIRDGKAWVPVEITDRSAGFVQSWEIGAENWRVYDARNQAGFYSTHEGWEDYQPIAYAGSGGSVSLPSLGEIDAAYTREARLFAHSEIADAVRSLRGSETGENQNTRRIANRLGITYARYGLLEEAEIEFRRSEGASALANLGNVLYLQARYDEALEYYKLAADAAPEKALVQLSVARTLYRLGDYAGAAQAYERLVDVAPEVAEKNTYLGASNLENSRRATRRIAEPMTWDN